jgi:hypothetical protein
MHPLDRSDHFDGWTHLRQLPAVEEDVPISFAEVTRDGYSKPYPDDE